MAEKQKAVVVKRNTIEIDVTRLDKSKFREWKRGDGSIAKFCSMDVVYTDVQEVVKKKDGTSIQGGGRTLYNVGFVTQSKANKDEPNGAILGGVKEWIADDQPAPQEDNQTSPDENVKYPDEDINPNDIPF